MRLLFFIFFLILLYPLISPLFNSGLFSMHDPTQVARVHEMYEEIRQGQFPVRWVQDLGYGFGYPIFNFYGPFPYYVGAVFKQLGFSSLIATKLMLGSGMVFGAICMYCWLSLYTGSRSWAILSSILYAYAPYHAVQLYVRGSIGEMWVLVFLPCIAYGMMQTSSSRKWNIFIGVIGIAGTILSHTILGYVSVLGISCILISVSIYKFLNKKLAVETIHRSFAILISGVILTSFFWLPAIMEMRFTSVSNQIGSSANYMDHFVCIEQLWDSIWGFGGSTNSCIDGMSYKIGKIHIILALLTIVLVFLKFRTIESKIIKLYLVSFFIILISIFMMLSMSEKIWKLIPGFAYIQYPWRFLSYVIFSVSTIAGGITSISKSLRVKVIIVFLFIVICYMMNGKFFKYQYQDNRTSEQFTNKYELTHVVSAISDEYLPKGFSKPSANEIGLTGIVPSDTITVLDEIKHTTTYQVTIRSSEDTNVILYQTYFPGWRFYLNKHEVEPITVYNNMFPVFAIPSGTNTFTSKFTNTPARLMGNFLSLATLALLCYYLMYVREKA